MKNGLAEFAIYYSAIFNNDFLCGDRMVALDPKLYKTFVDKKSLSPSIEKVMCVPLLQVTLVEA